MPFDHHSTEQFTQGDAVVVEGRVAHITGDAVFVEFTPPAAGWPVLSRVAPDDMRTINLHQQAAILRSIAEGRAPWPNTHDRLNEGTCIPQCRGCALVQVADQLEGKHI